MGRERGRMPRPSILHLSSSALWVASLALRSALRIGPQEAPRTSSALRAAWRAHRSCSRTHMLVLPTPFQREAKPPLPSLTQLAHYPRKYFRLPLDPRGSGASVSLALSRHSSSLFSTICG